MAVRCFAPSVRVIPGSGTVSAFLYWARNIHILRASAATSFHSTHVRWINTCDAKGNTIKRQDQSEDFLHHPWSCQTELYTKCYVDFLNL